MKPQGFCAKLRVVTAFKPVRMFRLRLLHSLLVSFLLIGFSVLFESDAFAQWNYLYTFSSSTSCIYFLPGPPVVGFAGCDDGTLYRTTNGGASWTTPNISGVVYPITSFSFKDSLTGWLSISGTYDNSYTSCYATTDGGMNWTPTIETGPKSAVYYNKASRRVLLVGWLAPLDYSLDLGATWQSLPYGTLNGAAFLSDSVGVLGAKIFPPNLFSNFVRTTDAGVSWHESPLLDETWQPFAVSCSQTFFALSEKSGKLYRSDDSAKSWYLVYSGFGNYPGQSAGMLAGDNGHLITQTDDGVYLSLDQAQSWNVIPGGPPAGYVDTRFYYANGIIYAGDILGRLYSYSLNMNPNTSTLLLTNNTLALESSRCTTIDTSIRITGPELCEASYILSVTALDSSDITLGTSVPLPNSAEPPVRLLVHYAPGTTDSTGTRVRIHFASLNAVHDTIITISAVKGVAGAFAIRNASVQWVARNACTVQDTTIVFYNHGCDTLWITRASMRDSSYFHLSSQKLPLAIPPGDSINLDVLAEGVIAGSFSTWLDLRCGNSVRSTDTSLSLALQVLVGARPVLNTQSFDFRSLCAPYDSSFTISNPGCDTLVISQAIVTGAPDFAISPTQFPIRVAPGDSVVIPLVSNAATVESVSGAITVRMTMKGAVYDTLLRVRFSVKSGQVAIHSVPVTPDAGVTSVCANSDVTIYLQSPLCSAVLMDSFVLTGDSNDFSLRRTLSLPRNLAFGEIDTVIVRFAPQSAGTKQAILRLFYTIDGAVFDTIIKIEGTGSSALSANLTSDILLFDTLPPCSAPQVLSTWFVNSSCDSVQFTNLSLPVGTDFIVKTPVVSQWVHRGDSVLVTVEIEHSVTGLLKDSATFDFADGKGNSSNVHLGLDGFVLANSIHASVNVGSLQLDSLVPCSAIDTIVILRNLSGCDSIQISSIALTGSPELALTNLPVLPKTLNSGDSLAFTLRLAPGDQQVLSGTIQILGPGFDTSISVAASSSVSKNTNLVVQPNSREFSVSRCSATSDTLLVINQGCGNILVDSLSLFGQDNPTVRYQYSSIPALPYMLAGGDTGKVVVRFDGSSTGDTNATLTIGSNGVAVWRSITLQGSVVAPEIVHFELRSLAGTKVASDLAGGRATVVSSVQDSVPASANLRTVSYRLAYDDNVLTLLGLRTSQGWILSDSSTGSGFIQLLFTRSSYAGLSAGTSIDTIIYGLSIGDSLETNLTMSALECNPGDSTSADCVLQPLLPTPVAISISPSCGDTIFAELLHGVPLFQQLSIQPNPSGRENGGKQVVNLKFLLDRPETVSAEVTDALGRELGLPMTLALNRGAQSLEIPTGNLAGGVYFVRVSADGQSASAKLVIER